jgi:hypothetical protein
MSLMHKRVLNLFFILTLLASSSSSAEVATDKTRGYDFEKANLYKNNKFAIGIGIGIVKFDSNVKAIDKGSSLPIYIDLEGTLDLPEISHVTNFYGAYKFNNRHSLIFSYFGINRNKSLKVINEEFDDIFIVNANIDVNDKSQFYNLSYGYSLFNDDRSQITLLLGINSIDLKLTTVAAGEIIIDGETSSAEQLIKADVFAPLPLIGLNFGFNFTPQWSLTTAVSLIGGSSGDVSATVLQTDIYARYQISKHIGILLGATYFSASVDIDDKGQTTEVSYGYDGASIGMHFAF